MPLYSRDRTRRSLIDTVAFRAISQLATFLGFVVMVRAMSKEDFGAFNLLYAIIPLISMAASLGLENTLRRYQPEYLQAGNVAAATWLVRFVASTRFATNIVLLGVILLAWNFVAPFFKLGAYRAEFVLFCLLVLLFFQSRILQISLAAHMLHRYSVGSMALLATIKLALYGAIAWQGTLTVQGAILADIAAYGVAYLSMLGAYRRHCLAGNVDRKFKLDPVERRRLVRYAVFNNFNDAGTMMLTTKTDNLFIAAIIDPVSVAIYAFYTRLNEMVLHLLPLKFFENVVQPVFFSVRAGAADKKVPQYFSILLDLNLVLLWPILAYSTAFHAEIVHVVFGGKYVEHSWLLPVMVGFSTLNSVATPVTLVAQQEEKAGIILISKLFGIYNAVALLVLLPFMGVYGAAVASGSAQAMKNGFIWWHVRERARWLNVRAALLSSLVLWGGIVVACRGLGATLRERPFLSLAAGAIVVTAGFFIHLRSPAISADDRRILSAVLHGREATWLRRIGLLNREEVATGSDSEP